MKEVYMSFETSKLLKEKGFDWSTPKLYGKCRVYNGEVIDFDTECELEDEGKGDEITTEYAQYDMWWVKSDSDLGVPCPSQSVACRWLKEEKGMYISVVPDFNEYGEYPDDLYWLARVYDLIKGDYIHSTRLCISSQAAFETAIQYVLTNLI